MKFRTTLKGVIALSAVTLSSLTLTSCIVIQGPPIDAPVRPSASPAVQDPVFVEGGSAEDNFDYFTKVLIDFAESETDITSSAMVSALSEGGFDKGSVEHTQDKTKTNLDAESITVSVKIETDCLLGQISKKSRQVFVDLAPAVGPEKNICLIGGILAD